MYWANFLHLYQPADQQPDILEAIVVQSYRPLFHYLKSNKNAKITLNITGSLLELFDKYGYHELIAIIRELAERNQIEFTGSAKYHALLPYLDEAEIIRQIEINTETNKKYLGNTYNPKGFFPPEMAYHEKLIPILEKLGFEWIILDEIAATGNPGEVDYTRVYTITESKLNVFFRERRLSNAIMSAVVRSPESVKGILKKEFDSGKYIITAMDGETFGHHRPGLEKLLFALFETQEFQFIHISEIHNLYKEKTEVLPIRSTWASSKLDIEKNIQFLSWRDPENEIHAWQWEFVELCLAELKKLDRKKAAYENVREAMDRALASDHFWWASAKPWWSVEMIEDGAYHLLDTIRKIPNCSDATLLRARDLYERIISTAFHWQRTGRVRKMMKDQNEILRIPFKERTLGKGGAEKGVYYAFLEMMHKLEKKAYESREYEKAILWRDAIYKLENKHDIYDAINVIDLLRVKITNEEVEKTIEIFKGKYRDLRGGQPEQRGS
jgi:hypothetical protein